MIQLCISIFLISKEHAAERLLNHYRNGDDDDGSAVTDLRTCCFLERLHMPNECCDEGECDFTATYKLHSGQSAR